MVFLAIGMTEQAVNRKPLKSTNVIKGMYTFSSVASPEVKIRANDRSSCPAMENISIGFFVGGGGGRGEPAFMAEASLQVL